MFFDPVNHQCNILFYQFSPQEELERFHSKMTETLSPLRAGTLSDNVIEVAERVARVVIAPFIYLVLGMLTCIEWTLQQVASLYQHQSQSVDPCIEEEMIADISEVAQTGEDQEEDDALKIPSPKQSCLEEDKAQTQIQTRKEEKEEVVTQEEQNVLDFPWGWPEEEATEHTENPPCNSNDLTRIPHFEAMRSIKRSRLDNVEEELVRLRKQGTLTPGLEKDFDKALAKVETYKLEGSRFYQTQVKALLGRALEIKNLYQETHYLFSHAQATKYFVSVCLIKELVKVFFPKRNVQFSQFLRVPHLRTTEVKDFKSILADASVSSTINDHQEEVREKLLSADAYLFNAEAGESALNFLCRNYSVLDNIGGFNKLFSFIFSHFLTKRIPKPTFDELCDKALNIASRVQAVCGNLFVICIPKRLVEDADKTIVYRAHPYGRPCDCHLENKDIEILKQLQQGNLNLDCLCRGQVVPQFRLLAAALTPENGVYTFGLTPFTREEKKKLKTDIAKVAVDAYKAIQEVS